MFKQGAEEALPQLRILLQIRRVGFYIKCKYFSNIYDLFGFSKFGQLRIGGQSAKPEFKTLLVCNVIQCGMGIDCCFGVFQSLFIIFLVRQWPKEELLKQLRKL
jgi:choline/glycine/proline betaine transport protein